MRGRGSVVGIRYIHNLRPMARYQHRWTYGLEYRQVDNRVGLVGGSPDLVPDITVHPASIGYAATWTGEGQQLEVSSTYVRNIPGGANGGASAIAAARATASADYAILRYAANYVYTTPADWRLRIAGEGQYTRDALVSGEQFGIGGQDSVRGFYERSISNDTGHRITLEVQTPNLGGQFGPNSVARALIFIDQGRVRRNHPLPSEVVNANISSVGAGWRVSMVPSWHLRVDVAHVIQGAGIRARGDERLHFSAGFSY